MIKAPHLPDNGAMTLARAISTRSLPELQRHIADHRCDLNAPLVNFDPPVRRKMAALHLAVIQFADAEMVRMLLASGRCDVNARDEDGHTPLHYAAIEQCVAAAQLLIDDPRCDLNAVDCGDGYTALHFATLTWCLSDSCESPTPSVFDCMTAHFGGRCDVNVVAHKTKETALNLAFKYKLESTVMPRSLMDMISHPSYDINRYDFEGSTPLHNAVNKNNLEVVKALVATGRCRTDAVDINGNSALHLASSNSRCFMSRTTSHPSGGYGFLLHYFALTFMARAKLYIAQNTMKSYMAGGAPMIVLQEGEMVLNTNVSFIIDNNTMEVGLAGGYNNAHISFQINNKNVLFDGSLFAWRNNHLSGFCHTEFLYLWPAFQSQGGGGVGGTVEISQNYFFYGPGTRYSNRMLGVSLSATFGPDKVGRIMVSSNTFNYSYPIQQTAEKGIIVVGPQTDNGGNYEISNNVILDSTPLQCQVTSIYIELPTTTRWINMTISDNVIVRRTAAARAFIYVTGASRLASSLSMVAVKRNSFTSLVRLPTRYLLDGVLPNNSSVILFCDNLWYGVPVTRFTDSQPKYQVAISSIVFCRSATVSATRTRTASASSSFTPPPTSLTATFTSSSITAPSHRVTSTAPIEGTTTAVPDRIEQTKTRSLAHDFDDDDFDTPIEVSIIPPDVVSTVVGAGVIGGGWASAGDVQALALVSMASCTNPTKSHRESMIRAVSPFAVSNTCEGALTGNVILIVAAALWCVFGALIAKKYFVTQNDDEKSSPWQAALAIVRAPSLVIFSAIFSINSAALCGSEYLHETQYKWAGALLWVWCVAVVVSLPLIAFLFGTRRYKVTRHPSCLAKVFIPNGYFDIEVGEDHYASVYRCPPMMFSSVVGPYRFSSAIFSLTGVLSSVAVWPVVLLPAGSDHCMGMYWFSAALHFVFALLIVAVRPRRVLLFDLCQAASLLLNGILIALIARQFLDGSYKATSLGDYGTIFESIEYVVVALAITRVVVGLALPVYNYRKGSQWALAMDLIDGLLSAKEHRADTAWEYAGCLLNGKLAHKVEIPDFFSDMNLAQSFTSRSSNCKTLPPEPIEMVDSVKYDSEFHAAFIPVVDVPDKESDVKRKKEPIGPKSLSPTGPIQQEKVNTSDNSEATTSTDSEDENYL